MHTIDLSGTWQLSSASGTYTDVPAALPGDTHSALLAAGLIADPYWGANELDLQPLNKEDWILTRRFNVEDDLLQAPSVYLHFDSLDTVAEVRLNGHTVGTSDNMFSRCRFAVKEALRPGDNQIEIHLRSAEETALQRAAELPYEIPFSIYPVQSLHRNLVRKVQCHAGWDWGCCLMVAGAYGRLFVAAADPGRIEYVYTQQCHGDGAVHLDLTCEAEAAVAGACDWTVRIDGQTLTQSVLLQEGRNELRCSLTIKDPKLWWPNGMGEQPLYDLEVSLGGDTVRKRLGLRTLDLITEADDIGLGFKFRVNGVDLFAKGANWIPADALPSRQTRAVLDDLLQSAADAHMNMIRVWGGGQYESDDFYELCDEKGLMVWQDFMFSCSTYPADPEFLASVRHEARHQVKRLRDHACIALWCGNNEDLGALNWYEVSRRYRDRYVVDYDRLNEGVLGKAVDTCDPTRTFWPSSPCGGRGDYSDNWHDDARGDMHYWSVWHSGKSFDAYYDVKPRFCSEFGYQSFPSMDSIRSYAPPDQFNVTAPIMEHHQRNPGGNSKITEMFTRYFRMPDGFANFVYLSQVQQGLAIKTAVEHWRHLRPVCMGTIYWQLNDLWPVCSWASLEYGGKWKLLHYMAKRFYAPTIFSAFQTKEQQLELWLTHDEREARSYQAALRVLDFGGGEVRRLDFDGEVDAGTALQLGDYAVSELAPETNAVFAVLDLEIDGQATRNLHFFAPYKSCPLPTAAVTTAIESLADGRFAVTLATDAPAFFVSLNADGLKGEFDDNCLTLLPGESRILTFAPKGDGPTAAAFKEALSLKHLRATYL